MGMRGITNQIGAAGLLCAVFAMGCGSHEEPTPFMDMTAPASTLDASGPVQAGSASTSVAAMEQRDAASAAAPSQADAAQTTVPEADAGRAEPSSAFLGLAAPSAGFRLETVGVEVPAQSDVEYCEVAEIPGAPGEEILVGKVEAANNRGSHHLIVSVAEPGSPADKKLRQRKVGDRAPCVAASIEFGEGLIGLAGSQTSLAKAEYPDGVGLRLFGGQRVVFDYHYFNYSSASLMAKSAVAVHTIERAKLRNIATSFAFTNMTLDTPAMSTKTFTAACRFKQDALLQGIGRHTHTWGTDFTVWYEGGAQHGKQIWTSADWEHNTGYAWDQPVLIKAGEGFKFACSFRNDTSKSLRFGIRASDEMCILTGAIWSPTPGVELKPESCVITWVDAQGIGHDARDDGGFPKPKLEEALACHVNMFGFGFLDACVGCICDSCATILARCNADADCKPLVDCRTSCQGTTCDEKCEPLMFEHSSATGMVSQVGECIAKGCGAKCSIGASAMTPSSGG